MKVRYTHGGLHPADLDKRRIMSSLNESNPSTDDPVLRRMRDQQLAAERAGMLEGKIAMGDDYMLAPEYPSGAIESDRSYLLDVAGLGSAGKSAIQKLMRSAGSKGSSKASIDAARREMLEGFSERTGMSRELSKEVLGTYDAKALQQMKNRQATSRVQNVADRAIRQGAQEESQAALNFQGKAQKILDNPKSGYGEKVSAEFDLKNIPKYIDRDKKQALMSEIRRSTNQYMEKFDKQKFK